MEEKSQPKKSNYWFLLLILGLGIAVSAFLYFQYKKIESEIENYKSYISEVKIVPKEKPKEEEEEKDDSSTIILEDLEEIDIKDSDTQLKEIDSLIDQL